MPRCTLRSRRTVATTMAAHARCRPDRSTRARAARCPRDQVHADHGAAHTDRRLPPPRAAFAPRHAALAAFASHTERLASSLALAACRLRFGAALAQLRGLIVRRARFDKLRIAGRRDPFRVAHDHIGDRAEQHHSRNQRDDDRFFRVRRFFGRPRRFRRLCLSRFFRRCFAELVEGTFGAGRTARSERRRGGGAGEGDQQHRTRAEVRQARTSCQQRVRCHAPSITGRIEAGNRTARRETSVASRAAQTVE
jgi:hypothetical protein